MIFFQTVVFKKKVPNISNIYFFNYWTDLNLILIIVGSLI